MIRYRLYFLSLLLFFYHESRYILTYYIIHDFNLYAK